MHRRVTLACLAAVLLCVVSQAPAGTLGFGEDFALADDRAEALKQLVPGTNEYYYFHSLHYLQTDQMDRLEQTLKNWQARGDRNKGLVEEILLRRALRLYPRQGSESLDFLRKHLSVNLHHQRRRRNPAADLPTRLDQAHISRKAYVDQFLARNNYSLDAFEPAALNWLPDHLEWNETLRRNYLRKLPRPDYDNILDLIVQDLRTRGAGSFGYLPVHGKLTKAQLDELLNRDKQLRNDANFVMTYLQRLRPPEGMDWRHDKQLKAEYLARLWSFVQDLGPAHNTLKANILYQRLVLDRSMGRYDMRLFMTYLKLPRQVPYIQPRYLRDDARRRHMVNLSANYANQLGLGPIHHDQPLIKSYFLHFFRQEEDWEQYNEYVHSTWLKRWFAEAKILSGQGDPEKWASLLTPGEFQALKDRVDIDFAYTTRERFDTDEKVSLTVHLKNVDRMLIKIYRIHTLNYYRSKWEQVGTDIQLDGLVPNASQSMDLGDLPDLRRVTRTLDLPQLDGRGVYVVDLIGNGKASRALIRKGKLHFLHSLSPTGRSVILRVLNEQDRLMPDAAVLLGKHRFEANDDGLIRVPLSTEPGRKRIILQAGDFSQLDWFHHPGADYRLQAGFHVEQEDLLERTEAEVIVRPRLLLGDTPVSVDRLTDLRLDIRTTDLDGISSSMTVTDIQARMDKDIVVSFQVPRRLRQIDFTLKAKIELPTTGSEQELSASRGFQVNRIDTTARTCDLHLVPLPDGWAIDVLGKTGEGLGQTAVHVTFRHEDVTQTISRTLQSDRSGRVHLGALAEIESITAAISGLSHTWPLDRDRCVYSSSLNARQGRTIRLPYMGKADRPLRHELSLLETRGGQFVADRFEALSIENGFIEITGLNRGDYSLWIKPANRRIHIRVQRGEILQSRLGDYVLGEDRYLELPHVEPMQITSVSADEENLRIRLANPSDLTVVHVTAVRFAGAYDPYGGLATALMPPGHVVHPPVARSAYVTGRDIGDEYRYVLARKDATIYPGNMLDRPGLILNPWALRTTETGVQRAKAGGLFSRAPTEEAEGLDTMGPRMAQPKAAGQQAGFADLNFLAEPGVVLGNLVPDANGVIEIPRKLLEGKHLVQIVAADAFGYVSRSFVLPEPDAGYVDLRLVNNLDPEKHFLQQRQIQAMAKGETFKIADVKTTEMEIYDSLTRVYGQYVTLAEPKARAELMKFSFVLTWPELELEKKRELYSEHACHELHFFLSRKDPKFFDEVVKPYLAHKKDKTFLDHYLLEDTEALRTFLAPWAHARLNVAERILLARALPGEMPHTREHIGDLLDLLGPDAIRDDYFFQAGLGGQALSGGDSLLSKTLRERRVRRGRSGALPEPGAIFGDLDGPARAPADKAADESREMKRKLDERMNGRRRESNRDGRGLFRADANEAEAEERLTRLYRRLEKTREYAENNYWHLPITSQVASLVDVNEFWMDYAQSDGGGFLSPHFSQASGNFSEIMLALALLDLPFQSPKHETRADDDAMDITLAGPAVLFSRQIEPAEAPAQKTPILVSENFFRADDRYRQENNQRVDKFITEEFVVHVVYGAQVVITNPTSSRQQLEALIQIPRGAMPVSGGKYTDTRKVQLEPYSTTKLEYYFYFPAAGDFAHYPLHVSKDEKLVATAEAMTFHVVAEPTKVDTESWQYVSQYGTPDQVIEMLKTGNPQKLDLELIAWRMKDKDFFTRTLSVLRRVHAYNQTLWGYGFQHDDPGAVSQYLRHHDRFISQVGPYIDTRLLTINPVERHLYQHLEYWPLVNARRHRLGPARQIPNQAIYNQYTSLLEILIRKPRLSDEDHLAVVYYLLLQDRVGEAIERFQRVEPDNLETRLQYDYFQVYLAFYTESIDKARRIAAGYEDYPVDRWRKIFAAALTQIDQIRGRDDPELVDDKDRAQQQAQLAANQPSVDMKVESRKVTLHYRNIREAKVNYYLMDIELLFSRNPFVKGYAQQFSYVRPNASRTLELPEDRESFTFDLPGEYHSANVLVEVEAAGISRSETYFANTLAVQVIENYGQLSVTSSAGGKALSKVYVKVYARTGDGQVKFFKDGYTDLRGRFDYTSLSTDEMNRVERFAILVLSPEHGAVVREAAPPTR